MLGARDLLFTLYYTRCMTAIGYMHSWLPATATYTVKHMLTHRLVVHPAMQLSRKEKALDESRAELEQLQAEVSSLIALHCV